MIEEALYNHLIQQEQLLPFLARYGDDYDEVPAIFNQEAPADKDPLWGDRPQYGRIVFAVDLQGDPARIMGGSLAVDIMCHKDEQSPEDIEPIIREVIDGYFFSNGTFTVAANWRTSSYFTQPTDGVTGCTVTFDLLGFPVLSTCELDVIERFNEWTASTFADLHVINYNELPSTAWKPTGTDSAVYWRVVREAPAGWIPDTYQTIWRTATVRCHIFSADISQAITVARNIAMKLYAVRRILRDGEAPIMVNTRNTVDYSADALQTGQLTVEATFGVIIHYGNTQTLDNITFK